MGTYVFGTTNIPLTYTDQELTQKVKKMVNDMPTTFTFQNLCQQILVAADKEGKLRKEPETEYSTIHLTTNALFFDDSTMHKIYIDEGNYNLLI